MKLEEIQNNAAIRGILPDALVTVVSVQWFGSVALELTYKTPAGMLLECCLPARNNQQPGGALRYLRDLVVSIRPVLVADTRLVPAAECLRAGATNHTAVTFLRGMYSLNTSKNAACGRSPNSFDLILGEPLSVEATKC